MIVRRIAQSIRQQQWTPFIIELVIVIAGVFIAFQVTDWGNQRASRDAERRHLEEIADDVRADLVELDKIRAASERRISTIDYILGETRGVNRPARLVMPSGLEIDIPAAPAPEPTDRFLLARANLVRSTGGHRTGFEALIGAGGMQTIRERKISRQIQVYYAGLDDHNAQFNNVRQVRAEGVTLGYPLGLSAFGEMDPDKVIAIVRGSLPYSTYLRTSREWTAIYLLSVADQTKLGLDLLKDIDGYLGKESAAPLSAAHE